MELTTENVEFIQSACNPVAVATTFAEWIAVTRKVDPSWQDNPLLLGVLGKLCSMFNLDHDGARAYAYMTLPKIETLSEEK